jgi:hypothetical protein
MFKVRCLVLLAAALAGMLSSATWAQEPFPARTLKFDFWFAGRRGDASSYCLLGNGFFRTLSSGEVEPLIKNWLAAHQDAQAIPVTVRPRERSGHWVYLLVEDGGDNLNAELVRAGAVPGRVMLDLPNHAGSRLVMPEEKYLSYLKRVEAAETEAKANQRGIWGDKYEASRKLERLE